MSCAVRLFSYSGLLAAPWANNNQLATNAEYFVKEPYLAKTAITADTGAAVATDATLSPAGTAMLKVEVQRGRVVHYEVTPANGTPVTATTSSPTIDGKEFINFGPGYLISILEAGSEA
ncbi:MAG: hypothetical protein JSS20_12795 [Proteobacteria bacterium]|nr:hypothetical protein [Pseudomonadota bacterium]